MSRSAPGPQADGPSDVAGRQSGSFADAIEWLDERRRASGLQVREVSPEGCEGWSLTEGEFRHATGRYFQVTDARVSEGRFAGWHRSMLRQHEVGILGFIVAERHGDVHWLCQAKTEPGNVSGTQLAPTVQATQSNQDRVHGGAGTRFLEVFDRSRDDAQDASRVRSDLLASEQGTCFLQKLNRNIVVAPDRPPIVQEDEAWRWLPGRVVREMLGRDFTVNTDARSVITTSPWALIAAGSRPFVAHAPACGFGYALRRSYEAGSSVDDVTGQLDEARASAEQLVEERPLRLRDGRLATADTGRLVRDVVFAEIDARDREVAHWCQPFIVGRRTSSCDLVAQERGGVTRFLFRLTFEPGLKDLVELGPTFQLGGRSVDGRAGEAARELEVGVTRLSVRQSDEGGRFLRSIVRYRVVELSPGVDIDATDGIWLDLSQVEALAARPGTFTNEARSVISLLLTLA